MQADRGNVVYVSGSMRLKSQYTYVGTWYCMVRKINSVLTANLDKSACARFTYGHNNI